MATLILGIAALALLIFRARQSVDRRKILDRTPYPGLAAFSEEYENVFFGRAAEIRAIVDRLNNNPSRTSRVVIIVGPSGVGKSSLLLAGVLPRLKRLGQKWLIIPGIVPGNRPAENLGSAIRRGLEAKAAEHAKNRGWWVRTFTQRCRATAAKRILIVIDQAEELFTLSGYKAQEEFLVLLEASLNAYPDLVVIFTLRAEFLGLLLETRWSPLFLHPIAIGALSKETLLEVVQKPASLAGITFDPPDLPIEIVHDVDSGLALPLLAYTLEQLYLTSRSELIISQHSYESLGRVKGIIARRADQAAHQLTDHDPSAPVMEAMLKLVTLGEEYPTRRRVVWDEFSSEERAVVDAFIDARLVVADVDEQTGKRIVQVTHEAIFRSWTPLAQQIETMKSQLRWRADLERWAQDWRASGMSSSYLLQGDRLRAAEQWLGAATEHTSESFTLVARFIEQSRWADTETMLGLSTSLARLSLAELDRNPEYSLRLALAAYTECGPTSPARRALISAIQASKVRSVIQVGSGAIWGLAWSPDSVLLASGSADGVIRIWKPETATCLALLAGHRKGVRSISWSPDGLHIVSGSDDQTVKVWDARSYSEVTTFYGHSAGIRAVAWSPDGRRLATASDDKTARIWDVGTETEQGVLTGHRSGVRDVDWAPDGETIATASDDCTIRLWDARGFDEVKTLSGHRSVVWSVAWSPTGEHLASTSEEREARLWNPISGDGEGQLRGHSEGIWEIDWDPTGRFLATASYDRSLRLWELSTLNSLLILKGHEKWVRTLAWSPSGELVASGSEDETIRLWDVRDASGVNTLRGHEDGVWSVCWSPDGRRAATASYDQTVRVWLFPEMREQHLLRGHTSGARAVDWSPRGDRIVSGGLDGKVMTWDPATGGRIATFNGHEDGVWAVQWSPDGRRIASASYDRTVRVWDQVGQRELLVLRGHDDGVRSVSWSFDGQYLASTSYDRTVRIWAGDG